MAYSPPDTKKVELEHLEYGDQTDKGGLATAEQIDGDARIIAPTTSTTKEEENAVIRSLDWHIMPLIFVLYSLSVLDRSNLGNARIAGMSQDINIGGNRYSWLGTAFYIACTFCFFRLVKRD